MKELTMNEMMGVNGGHWTYAESQGISDPVPEKVAKSIATVAKNVDKYFGVSDKIVKGAECVADTASDLKEIWSE